MKNEPIPLFIKFTWILFGIFLLVLSVFYTQHMLIPFSFAVIFSILLNPVVNFLERKGIGHLLAISIALVGSILIVGLLIFFIVEQVSLFADDLPKLQQKFSENLVRLKLWLGDEFNISAKKQVDWINKGMKSGEAMLGSTLYSMLDIIFSLTLIPVYVFLILLYKPLFQKFILELSASFSKGEHVSEIVAETKIIIQSYVLGLIIEAAIIAALNSTGLLILGIDYAILFGVLGALLNLVPYIGGIIAVVLPVSMALVTKDSFGYALGIVGLYAVIQFIDNHYISPTVVASKVRINALISILAVLAGGAIAGVGGMFLSIPAIAIVKIIFDRVDTLKPWGTLLGDGSANKSKSSLNERLTKTKKK